MWDIQKYLSTLQNKNTHEIYQHSIRLFCEYTDYQKPTPELMQGFAEFVKAQDWAISTKRLRLQTIKRWNEFRYQHGLINTGDWFDLDAPIEKALDDLPSHNWLNNDVRLLSREEVERAYKIINEPLLDIHQQREKLTRLRNKALFMLLISIGLRISEACNLTYGDLDWKTGQIKIIAKGNKTLILTLAPDVLNALTEYRDLRLNSDLRLDGKIDDLPLFMRHDKKAGKNQWPISPRTGENIIGMIGHRAGISGLTPHMLRHYAATNLLHKSGGDAFLVQGTMGHKQVTTSSGYVHLGQDYTIKKLRKLGNGILEPN